MKGCGDHESQQEGTDEARYSFCKPNTGAAKCECTETTKEEKWLRLWKEAEVIHYGTHKNFRTSLDEAVS